MLDKVAILTALERMGLHPACDIMVHASLSALGMVEGGAGTVVEALMEVSGVDGAVIIPSFRDAIRSEHYSLRQCQSCCPQELCSSREEGYTGVIGETVRERPGSLRSCHPTHSWAGVGTDARFLLEGHRNSLTPCGKDSPFFRLMERDGKILLLGVGVNSLTNIHAVEDARNAPYLSAVDPPRRHATYTTSGRRIQYVYPELLYCALREVGILVSIKVGAGMGHLISARTLGAFLWVITEDDLWCLVLRPRGNQYEPFEDAFAKVSRMVHVWKADPNHTAWKCLLEKSRVDLNPVLFQPAEKPVTQCPAYRGEHRGYHRCAANDIPPWEKFEDYPPFEPGVATCNQCNWPTNNKIGEGDNL